MISEFNNIIDQYKNFNYKIFFDKLKRNDIEKILLKENLSELEFLSLFSPLAEDYLEYMAQKAQQVTVRHFGKTIQLYTPMYISNHCNNQCVYCGFKKDNKIKREQLTIEEIEKEAIEISKTGLRHILVLTGSARNITTQEYIQKAIKVIRKHFNTISLEMYPMEYDEYKTLFQIGADGLTVYQETYDKELYIKLHPMGPKRDYQYRLSAADRACKAGMRRISLGSLLGLKNWKEDIFMAALHCNYIQNRYPATEVSLSLPRIQSHEGNYQAQYPVSDKNMVQIIAAFRLFMPRGGINISTRETPYFRNNIIQLGITNMSAGCTTAVGGHTKDDKTKQFEIADTRSVNEVKDLIYQTGYQPVFKDWQYLNNEQLTTND